MPNFYNKYALPKVTNALCSTGPNMKQRQKVQAVELLKEKQLQKIALKAQREEQKMFDEIATQQFVRRSY